MRPSGWGALRGHQGLAWLFSVVNLPKSGRSYDLGIESTSLGYLLRGVKWVDPLLVGAFEVGKHSPLIRIFNRGHTPRWKPI